MHPSSSILNVSQPSTSRKRTGRPRRVLAGLALSALLLSTAACTGLPATQAAFDAHQTTFTQTQPHLQHTVTRADGGRLAAREFNAG